MRKVGPIALFAAAAIAATAFAVPAEAQSRNKNRYATAPDRTVIVTRDESGRTRTKVVVSPRSYLDGGTEVLPGQRKFQFRDAQPYWSPIDVLGPGRNYDRQPLNAPWESGGTRCCF
jgi:hypothetical protein